jgi:CheY-like chemotaxis protein
MTAEPRDCPHPQILVVEDDPATQALLKVVLGKEDHWQPTTVGDGGSAIEAWIRGDFDVILMDVRLPDMDGIEVTGRIREMERLLGRKRTPIIAFSALPGQEKRQKFLASGFNDFITKPAKMREVIDSVYRQLPEAPA